VSWSSKLSSRDTQNQVVNLWQLGNQQQIRILAADSAECIWDEDMITLTQRTTELNGSMDVKALNKIDVDTTL